MSTEHGGYTDIYSDAAMLYVAAGWPSPLPLPPKAKTMPPKGRTGDNAEIPTLEQLDKWIHQNTGRQANICVWTGPQVIGFDLDKYGDKKGGDTLAALEQKCGPLPPTDYSTSRDDGSGIYLYRIPQGVRLNSAPGPGIEICQAHHRYIVCWPSIHPDTGQTYRWHDQTGTPYEDGDIPNYDDIADLPTAWVTELMTPTATSHNLGSARRASREELSAFFLEHNTFGPPSLATDYRDLIEEAEQARQEGYSRHDTVVSILGRGLRAARNGDYPAEAFVEELQRWFNAATAGEKRELEYANAVFDVLGYVLADGEQIYGDPDIEPVFAPWQPLRDPVPEPPAFPLDVLPDWIRAQVDDVAHCVQVDPALPAMLAIGALSTLVTNLKTTITFDGQVERGNLYLIASMRPSSGKSPAFTRLMKPVRELEEASEKTARSALDAARVRLDAAQALEKNATLRLGAAQSAGQDVETVLASIIAAKEQVRDAEDAIPANGRWTCQDVTTEAFIQLLDQAGGTISLISDEGGLFSNLARYIEKGTAPNLDPYLQAFSYGTIEVDRKHSAPIKIRDCSAAICLTVQPEILETVLADKQFSGRGFAARFMVSRPGDKIGKRNFKRDRTPDVEVDATYADNLKRASQRLSSVTGYRLDAEATILYRDWLQAHEDASGEGGELAHINEQVRKIEQSALRLALLFHVADFGSGDVGVGTLERAIEVGEYWIAQFDSIITTVDVPFVVLVAEKIMEYVKYKDLKRFTASEVRDTTQRLIGSKDTKDLVPALYYLTLRGHITCHGKGFLVSDLGQLGQKSKTVGANGAGLKRRDLHTFFTGVSTDSRHGASDGLGGDLDSAPIAPKTTEPQSVVESEHPQEPVDNSGPVVEPFPYHLHKKGLLE